MFRESSGPKPVHCKAQLCKSQPAQHPENRSFDSDKPAPPKIMVYLDHVEYQPMIALDVIFLHPLFSSPPSRRFPWCHLLIQALIKGTWQVQSSEHMASRHLWWLPLAPSSTRAGKRPRGTRSVRPYESKVSEFVQFTWSLGRYLNISDALVCHGQDLQDLDLPLPSPPLVTSDDCDVSVQRGLDEGLVQKDANLHKFTVGWSMMIR